MQQINIADLSERQLKERMVQLLYKQERHLNYFSTVLTVYLVLTGLVLTWFLITYFSAAQ